MAKLVPRRPSIGLSFLFPAWLEPLPLITRRHQTTYRRTQKRLNLPPDPSFLPSKTESQDHIIFNPPPSAPSVYHTPPVFLPPDDVRRQLLGATKPKIPETLTQRLPPPVRKPYQKKYHLREDDFREMRRLRMEDPIQWSAAKLAKKFECSSLFVGFVTEGIANKKREQQKQVLDMVKSRWGPKRRRAREDRALRKENWGKDA